MGLFEDYLKVEEEKKFYDRELLGIKYWDFIRYVLYNELSVRKNGIANLVDASKPKGLKIYMINPKFLRSYLGLSKIKKAEILMISHPRRIKQNDKFYNIFVDPVVEQLSDEYSMTTLEEPCWCSLVPSSTGHFFPVETKDIHFTDLYELLFLIKNKIFRLCHTKEYQQISVEVDNILNFFEERYDIKLDEAKEHLIDKLVYIYIMRDTWEKVIDKINPKAVMLHYFPTSFKTLIISICNEKNIPTIELQHGIITYSEPIEHKTYDVNNCNDVPKYLFSFGDIFVDSNYLTTKEENLKCVGYPFLEKKVKEQYEMPEQLQENEKYILISSQSMIGKQMSEFASRLADLLKERKEYKIIYKYHPNEIKEDYDCLKKDNIISVKNLGEEIYKYQKFSSVQIGAYSTSLYEGIAFGLPTIILEGFKNADETIETLSFMDKGVYIVNNPEQAKEVIETMIEKSTTSDIDRIWKSDSTENIKKQLRKIIK